MFMAAVTSVNETEEIFEICNSCEDSVLQINYMIQHFFIIRINHLLCEQSRTFQISHQKRNKNTMKLLHIWITNHYCYFVLHDNVS